MELEAQSSERGATKGTLIAEEEWCLSEGKGVLGAQPLDKIKTALAKSEERAWCSFTLLVGDRSGEVEHFCHAKNIGDQ